MTTKTKATSKNLPPLIVPDEPFTPKNSDWDKLVEDFKAGRIHYIRSWTTKKADETPICGDDSSEAWLQRTENMAWVSCEACRLALLEADLTLAESDGKGIWVVFPAAAMKRPGIIDLNDCWLSTTDYKYADAFVAKARGER